MSTRSYRGRAPAADRSSTECFATDTPRGAGAGNTHAWPLHHSTLLDAPSTKYCIVLYNNARLSLLLIEDFRRHNTPHAPPDAMLPLLAALALAAVPAGNAFAPLANGSASRSLHATSLSAVAEDAKVCLVTGASRGLGASIALELGRQGQKVVVNYAGSADKAQEVVEQVKAAGGDAIAVQADCE